MGLRLVSRAILVGACYLGVACGGSESDDDSSGGSGAEASMSASGTGGGAGAGSGGNSGGSGGKSGSSGTGGGMSAGTGGTEGGTGGGGGGGGSGGTGASGDLPDIDPDALITDLTDEQKAELCDWMVELLGGYDVTTQCPVGSVKTFPSQELCVMAGLSFTCKTVTVGDVEACQLSQVPSGGCDRSDPSCLPLHCM